MSLLGRSVRAELEDKAETGQLPGLFQPWAQE